MIFSPVSSLAAVFSEAEMDPPTEETLPEVLPQAAMESTITNDRAIAVTFFICCFLPYLYKNGSLPLQTNNMSALHRPSGNTL